MKDFIAVFTDGLWLRFKAPNNGLAILMATLWGRKRHKIVRTVTES
jgi:hypothetical protein